MLTKTLTYDDVITGKSVTEDYHFNVARTDLIDFLIAKPEMEERLQNLATTMDGRAIIEILKEFIQIAVGRREVINGRDLFVKNEDVYKAFRYSGAYDALFWELANNPEQANAFLEGIFPAALIKELQERGAIPEELRQKIEGTKLAEATTVNLPEPNKDPAAQPVPDHPLATPTQELPNSGRIDTIEGEVVPGVTPTPFPGSIPEAIHATAEAGANGEADRPAWLKEMREPTHKEMIAMGKDEMTLAFRLKEEGKLRKDEPRNSVTTDIRTAT